MYCEATISFPFLKMFSLFTFQLFALRNDFEKAIPYDPVCLFEPWKKSGGCITTLEPLRRPCSRDNPGNLILT
ncbi:hypothetical protein CEXT_56221 [Caerostris extrusa]|uniref:Uncharacterized protein n=1 Tax=Caerostris extrusa TaxID=172846 RepID=A0AAV4R3X8_CAEEX|nr:hypothetical protein CEXT_56221 [Caerostris extrusa]